MRLLKKFRDFLRNRALIQTGLKKSFSLINITISQYNEELSNAIINGKPYMVSRFGSEELKWYFNYMTSLKSKFWIYLQFIRGNIDSIDQIELQTIDNLTVLPNKSIEASRHFYTRYKDSIPQIDVMGSWLYLERKIGLRNQTKFIFLFDLEPYKFNIPWTLALEGKRLLVVHPMVEIIESQWKKKDKLFSPTIWPSNIELKFLKAKYFDEPDVDTWEKMMDYYIHHVNRIEFDVAIIGCGPWGMPLAAHIKVKGKVAIHLGGATQILFGIYGKRWEEWEDYKSLFNEHWISGSEAEQKSWMKSYDKASYW